MATIEERAKVEDYNNLGVTVGRGLRNYAVPALKTTAAGVVDAATVVPRSIYHVGSNIAAGFRGEQGNNNFNVTPMVDAARGSSAPQVSTTGRDLALRTMPAATRTPQVSPAAPQPQANTAPVPITQTVTAGAASPDTPRGSVTANLSPNDLAIKKSLADIDAAVAGGMQPTPEQAAKIMDLKQQAGFLRGGTDRRPVGPDGLPLQVRSGGSGLTVQFDADTDPAAKQRFLENPVRPTAQINGFRPDDGSQGMLAAENASRILAGGKRGMPEAVSGGVSRTWEDAAANDAVVNANAAERRDYVRNVETDMANTAREQAAETAQLGFRNQSNIAAAGNAIDLRGQDLAAATAADKTALEAEELGIRRPLTQAQTKIAEAEAAKGGRLNALTDKLEKAPASEKAAIRAQINALSGIKEEAIKPHYGEVTNKDFTTSPYVVAPDGAGGFRMVRPQVQGNVQAAPGTDLTPEQKAKAVTYGKANPKVDKATILQKIRNGEI